MEDNELMHGGPGSGRWPKGSTGNVPNTKIFKKKKKKGGDDDNDSEVNAKIEKGKQKVSTKLSSDSKKDNDKTANDEPKKEEPKKEEPKKDNKEKDVINERLNKGSQIAYQTSKGLEAADKVNTALARNKNRKQTQLEIDAMDNDELRKRAERIELENRYKNATKDRISKGHERVQKTLAVAIPLATVTQYSLVIAKLVREMKQGK